MSKNYAAKVTHIFFLRKAIHAGTHEVVQDFAGRAVLYFKGRRSGFMPEYLDHPVKDMKTWEDNVKWRLLPDAPGRMKKAKADAAAAKAAQTQGNVIVQRTIGG